MTEIDRVQSASPMFGRRGAVLSRRSLMIGGASLSLALLAGPAGAQSETAAVEGTAAFRVGGREVVAFLDGVLSFPIGIFAGATDEELAELAGGQNLEGFINAFVVKGPDNLVLVDAGGGALVGPTAGKLGERMGAAGLDPAQIDVVLATHLHPDHVGGLLVEGGLVPEAAQLVVHEREIAHWRSDEAMAAAGERGAGAFTAARATLDMFGERVTPINADGDVPGGMRSVALFGHTPGHTGFMIDDGGQQMLIWGDIIHAPAIQFARPDVTIAFDVDPETAMATRTRVMDMVASEEMPVAGMHLAFPAAGRVARAETGYAFETL